ncbi:MAG: anti-sigma factor, partial [Silicimonas sp.]|nr:anti-sigma factor [Silicimonas sp.]
DERSAFESRLAVERDLMRRVWQWEIWLGTLADEVEEVAPPASMRQRVLSSIEARGSPRFRAGLWSLLLGGLAAASLLLFMVFGDTLRPPQDLTPEFQAELTAEDGSLVLIAGVIPATHEIVIERVTGAPPQGRVHELWLIAEGAVAPVSLGVLENEGVTRIRVPDEIAPGVRTGTIAISDEPPGGSPTGAPTGTVLATATFSDI